MIRRFLLCCLLSLGCTGFAQELPPLPTTPPSTSQNWFGVRLGYFNQSYPFGLALHFGVENPNGLDLRISGSLQRRERWSLGVGADVLRPFSEVRGLSVYGGAGGFLAFEGQAFLIDVHGLLGTQYRLVAANLEELGFFLEVNLGAALAVGGIPQPNVPHISALFGLNVYF